MLRLTMGARLPDENYHGTEDKEHLLLPLIQIKCHMLFHQLCFIAFLKFLSYFQSLNRRRMDAGLVPTS